MRELAMKRQSGTSIRKRAASALHEKKRFDTLIADVTEFVDKLVDLSKTGKESYARQRFQQSGQLAIWRC